MSNLEPVKLYRWLPAGVIMYGIGCPLAPSGQISKPFWHIHGWGAVYVLELLAAEVWNSGSQSFAHCELYGEENSVI